jgi:hypothetical protein
MLRASMNESRFSMRLSTIKAASSGRWYRVALFVTVRLIFIVFCRAQLRVACCTSSTFSSLGSFAWDNVRESGLMMRNETMSDHLVPGERTKIFARRQIPKRTARLLILPRRLGPLRFAALPILAGTNLWPWLLAAHLGLAHHASLVEVAKTLAQ